MRPKSRAVHYIFEECVAHFNELEMDACLVGFIFQVSNLCCAPLLTKTQVHVLRTFSRQSQSTKILALLSVQQYATPKSFQYEHVFQPVVVLSISKKANDKC
jgi:hypothetical protein